jgi:hypothetical protein
MCNIVGVRFDEEEVLKKKNEWGLWKRLNNG